MINLSVKNITAPALAIAPWNYHPSAITEHAHSFQICLFVPKHIQNTFDIFFVIAHNNKKKKPTWNRLYCFKANSKLFTALHLNCQSWHTVDQVNCKRWNVSSINYGKSYARHEMTSIKTRMIDIIHIGNRHEWTLDETCSRIETIQQHNGKMWQHHQIGFNNKKWTHQ